MSCYRYGPSLGAAFIRVAVIHPGNFEADLILDLMICPFSEDSLPEYEALSYVWGSSETLVMVKIGNSHESLPVTQNLDVALRHLRSAEMPRRLWVDAICIDQDNNDEKAFQVAMMGEVFRHATRVVAWLGPATQDDIAAMQIMEYLGGPDDEEFEELAQQWVPKVAETSKPYSEDADVPSSDGRFEILGDGERQVHGLLCRPWFDRLWIRQEIALANANAVVYCGPYSVLWKIFHRALLRMGRRVNLEPRHSYRMNELIPFIRQIFPITLADIRHHFPFTKCGDPRDRVYALRSLLCESNQNIVKIDYSITPAKSFQNVVVRWLEEYHQLDIIRECEYREDWSGPSWVPDWSTDSVATRRIPDHRASSHVITTYDITQADEGILRVYGVVVTTIQSLKPVQLKKGHSLLDAFEELNRLLEGTNPEEKYSSGGTLGEAYARALMLGCIAETWRVSHRGYTALSEAISLVRTVSRLKKDCRVNEFTHSIHAPPGLGHAGQNLYGRQLFTGEDGVVGVVPRNAQIGDKICTIVGCQNSMVIRPVGTNQGRLIGACWSVESTFGRALLGELPPGILTIFMGKKEPFHWAFQNTSTGEIFREDPRIMRLPIDVELYKNALKQEPNINMWVDPQILRDNNPNLTAFELI